MFLPKFAFLIALWLSVLNLGCVESEDVSGYVWPSPTGCKNHTVCPYPCHPIPPTIPSPDSGYPSYRAPPLSPPPVSGYPSYGAPPPPPLPPVSGYPSYGAPPPLPPVSGDPSYGAPPPPVFEYPSYRNPPPAVSGYPTYGAPPPPHQGDSPPVPCCQYPSPRPYEYLPYGNYSASSPLYSSLFRVMIIIFSLAVLLFFPGDLM